MPPAPAVLGFHEGSVTNAARCRKDRQICYCKVVVTEILNKVPRQITGLLMLTLQVTPLCRSFFSLANIDMMDFQQPLSKSCSSSEQISASKAHITPCSQCHQCYKAELPALHSSDCAPCAGQLRAHDTAHKAPLTGASCPLVWVQFSHNLLPTAYVLSAQNTKLRIIIPICFPQ